jgi:hypothetical protein
MRQQDDGLFGSGPLPDVKTGIISNFKDLLRIKKYENPVIRVCDPQLKSSGPGKHTVFKVVGADHLGEYEIFRRFREFNLLRTTLHSRFLGVYVPPIPEKKKMVSFTRLIMSTGKH